VKKREIHTHSPDRTLLPASLQQCDWKTKDSHTIWCDGQVILAAVPVCIDNDKPDWLYRYCLAVITIRCDDDFLNVEEADEPWGWELDDVDYWLPLYG